jgi:hypothetical protein
MRGKPGQSPSQFWPALRRGFFYALIAARVFGLGERGKHPLPAGKRERF